MTEETKTIALAAVGDRLSAAEDSLQRAQHAGKFHSLDFDWGESGRTLGQIIEGYRRVRDELAKAHAELEAL